VESVSPALSIAEIGLETLKAQLADSKPRGFRRWQCAGGRRPAGGGRQAVGAGRSAGQWREAGPRRPGADWRVGELGLLLTMGAFCWLKMAKSRSLAASKQAAKWLSAGGRQGGRPSALVGRPDSRGAGGPRRPAVRARNTEGSIGRFETSRL